MAYENLCMYCFKDLGGSSVCPHCGKDARAAVPQIQMLPGTPVYRDRFLMGRALGQDANGIVYTALDTKRGGVIRIREYLPRSCAERLNDGSVVPIAGMEDAFEAGMRKLRASVESVEDPKKRHFYFEENGTAYIAQRKNGASGAPAQQFVDDEDDAAEHKKQLVLYIAIAAAVVLAVAIGLIWFLNSMGDTDDVTLTNPLSTTSPGATWMPAQTPTPTPYATATFAALVDPELSWMDYTYSGNVNDDYKQQASAAATKKPATTQKPTIIEDTDYDTVNSSSSSKTVRALQEYLVKLGWMDYSDISGKYDSATRQAVKDFQTYVNEYCSPAKKLAVDGIAGEKTQQWLYNSSVSLTRPTPTPTPLVTPAPDDSVVNENSSASDVRALQKKLIALGVLKEGSADGKYGSATATAVKNFQIRVNQLQGFAVLEVTGKVDELTMAYLNYYIQWWENEQQATQTPTVTPTITPTAQPLETQPAQTQDPGAPIDASSSRKQIAYAQELLEKVGLLSASDVDGVYGSGTIAAVKTFQAWVNELRKEETLQVSGVCDQLTRTYLEYCVENNMTVQLPTETPTEAPTQAPELPTQTPVQPTSLPEYNPVEGEGETDDGSNTIDPASPAESISYVQEMLAEIGLMDYDQVDGQYGEITRNAVRRLQQYVNQQAGDTVLEVTGVCDETTLRTLMDYYDRGLTIPDQSEDDETAPAPTEVPEEDQQIDGISPDSSPESISFMQEMLAEIGLMDYDQADGNYGEITKNAVRRLQQFVNDTQGKQLLEVTGLCDETTLLCLQKCYDEGWKIGEQEENEPTETPTDEPVAEPSQAPSVGVVDSFSVSVAGMESDGGLIELTPGKYEVLWHADGDVAAYYLYLFDGNQTLLKSDEGTDATGFVMDTAGMKAGEIYLLKIGALPMNGTQDDILWKSVELTLPVQATAEPTEAPTPEPTPPPSVSAPSINIGSSVYQQDGVTYVNDSTIIFSWMADGDVESYTVELRFEDGTSYSLGSTTDTSKTVTADQLQPGLYKLYVGATPVGGDDEDTVWSELLFGVPAPEPTQAPEPDEPALPEEDENVISYIDASSAPEDIQTVQMTLYRLGLLNTDGIEPGVLDQGTLEAVAAFQQMVNEQYGEELYVIDPSADAFIDGDTLAYLLYREL